MSFSANRQANVSSSRTIGTVREIRVNVRWAVRKLVPVISAASWVVRERPFASSHARYAARSMGDDSQRSTMSNVPKLPAVRFIKNRQRPFSRHRNNTSQRVISFAVHVVKDDVTIQVE